MNSRAGTHPHGRIGSRNRLVDLTSKREPPFRYRVGQSVSEHHQRGGSQVLPPAHIPKMLASSAKAGCASAERQESVRELSGWPSVHSAGGDGAV